MTTEQLRRIAEACGYTILDGWEVSCGGKIVGFIIEWEKGPGCHLPFRPDLDANQAIECLNRRFGDRRRDDWWEGDGWKIEQDAAWVDPYCCTVTAKAEVRQVWGPTFPLAACNAILESLK